MKNTGLLFVLFFSFSSFAAIINVGTGANACTLHDAIRAANADAARGNCSTGNGADLIIVPAGETLVLNAQLPEIVTPMTIRIPANSTEPYTIDADGTLRAENGTFLDPNNFTVLRIVNVTNVSLQDLVLQDSVLDTTSLPLTGGAALYIVNSDVSLSKVKITGNFINRGTRIGAGVRITNNSNVSFEECVISDNELVLGAFGGSALGGNMAIFDSTVSINNTTILGVKSTTDGLVIVNSTATKGAGIYLDNSNLNLTKSYLEYHKLEDNSAPGVDLYAINNSTVGVENSTFYHNRDEAARTGSRVYLLDSQMTLNNVTLWGNHSGGGLELVNSTISATNSLFPIIKLDSSPGNFCKAYNSQGNVLPFSFQTEISNLVGTGDTSCGISLIDFNAYIGTGNLEYPLDNGGSTITSRLKPNPYSNDAYAVNNGDTDTCAGTDQRSFPRLFDCDIGAYELNDVTNLAIDMSFVTNAPYYSGQLIEYAVEVSNLGPSDAFGVQVSVDVSGLNIDSWQSNHSCSIQNTNSLTCSIASLAINGNTTIRLFTIKDATANFDADATVGAYADYSQDFNTDNNTDTTGNSGTTIPAADLQVTQTLLTPPPYFINQSLNYEITVQNLGASLANNVVLNHTLLGLSNTSYSGCNSSTTNSCNLNSISNGSSRTVNLTTTIASTTLKNTVVVSADEYDPESRNNTARNKNTVSASANIKVGGSISPAAPYYNEDFVTYNYSITNSGPDTATTIEVDFTNSIDNLFLVGVSGACNSLPCTIASLDSGNDVTVNFQAQILAPGSFFADFSVLADQTDDDLSNNSTNITKTANPAVDLNVSLNLLSTPPFYVGNTLRFEATIDNSLGAVAATSVLIDNLILDNLTLLQISSANCGALPCTLDNLDFGLNNQETITIYANVISAGDFTYRLRAYAAEHEVNSFNNEAIVTATAAVNPQDIIFNDGFE